MYINRKQIIACFLDSISYISDREYQRRVWIRGEGPECDAFDDAICSFSHEGEGILEKYKAFGISESQYEILKKFYEKLCTFSDDNDYPEEFIDTPEWIQITEMAKDVLKAFDYKKDES